MMALNGVAGPLTKLVSGLADEALIATREARERHHRNQGGVSVANVALSREKKATKKSPAAKRESRQRADVAMPAAMPIARQPRVGVADVKEHSISWVVGWTYVGNGTLGNNYDTYLYCYNGGGAGRLIVSGGGAPGGGCPIVPGDSLVGAPFAFDIVKHYQRIRFKKIGLTFVAQTSSTANNSVVAVAPSKGGTQMGNIIADASAGQQSQVSVVSMKGSRQFRCFDSTTVDLTPFIGGGSGARENEFYVGGLNYSSSVITTTTNDLGVLQIPCCFTVSGNCSSSGLLGTKLHLVIASATVDLLDYVGGEVTAYDPGMGPGSRGHVAFGDVPSVLHAWSRRATQAKRLARIEAALGLSDERTECAGELNVSPSSPAGPRPEDQTSRGAFEREIVQLRDRLSALESQARVEGR